MTSIGGLPPRPTEVITHRDIAENLTSVHQLCKETNCAVCFTKDEATIYHPDGGETTAKQENGLYPLDMQVGQSREATPTPARPEPSSRQTARVARETIGETLPNLDPLGLARTRPSTEKTRTKAHGYSACQAKHHEAEARAGEERAVAMLAHVKARNKAKLVALLSDVRETTEAAPTPKEQPLTDEEFKEQVRLCREDVLAARARARARVNSDAALWAARLYTNVDGTLKASEVIDGIDLDKTSKGGLTPGDRELIESDTHRVSSSLRRRPANQSRGEARAVLDPYEEMDLDGWGPAPAASVVTGRSYMMHAVCRKTGMGYAIDTMHHTTEDWIAWLHTVLATIRAKGRTVRILRVDAASELASPTFARRAAKELGTAVLVAPGGFHEGVSMCEKMNDVYTRMAEASVKRAGRGPGHFIPARMYAVIICSMKAAKGQDMSRIESADGIRPDATVLTPYLYGTEVAELEDKPARGAYGSVDKGRAPLGIIVGMEDAKYLVRKHNTGETVRRRHVTPLNERALLRSGIPSGVALADEEAQTPPLAEFALPPPPPPRPRPEPIEPNGQRKPIGTKLEFHFEIGKERTPHWFACQVVGTRTLASGAIEHAVDWAEDDLWHPSWSKEAWRHVNLSNDTPIWRYARAPAQAKPVQPAQGPLRKSPRLQAGMACSMQAIVDAGMDPEYAEWVVTGDDDDGAGMSNERGASDAGDTALKATQNVVDVMTDLGVVQMSPPATAKQVKAAVDSQEWMAADVKGVDAILAQRGNRLVTRTSAEGPVQKTVTARKFKIDPHTSRLAASNGRKSRHSLDGGYAEMMAKRSGRGPRAPATADAIDEMALNMLIADAAGRRRSVTKGDVAGFIVSTRGYLSIGGNLPLLR